MIKVHLWVHSQKLALEFRRMTNHLTEQINKLRKKIDVYLLRCLIGGLSNKGQQIPVRGKQ
jgi:hypothetical protein